MEQNENLVAEQAAEKAEPTAEESPKIYTEEEFEARLNEIVGKKLARQKQKIKKEYEEKYGGLENVLKAGTGKKDVAELTETFTEYYTEKGVEIPKRREQSDRDMEILGKADAEDIIRDGYDDVVEELDRLSAVGATHMNEREKAMYKHLTEYRVRADRGRELGAIGVSREVWESEEFSSFASKFTSEVPIREVYEMYEKTRRKEEPKTAGSLKNSSGGDGGVKDYYSLEEAKKFTVEDFKRNPALQKAVEKSMPRWR